MVIGKQGMDFLEAEKENSIKKPKNVTILTHEHGRDKNGEEILEKQKAIVNKLDNMRRFIQYDISETDNPDETLKYLNDLQEVVSKLTYPSKMMKKGKIPYKQAKSKKQTEEPLGQATAEETETVVQEPPSKLSEARIRPEILEAYKKRGPKKKNIQYVDTGQYTLSS